LARNDHEGALLQQLVVVGASSSLLILVQMRSRNGLLGFGLTVAWLGVAVVGFVTAVSIPYPEELSRSLRVVPAALFSGTVAVNH
jgi:hypothetical protein